ncbi:MAG: hypothetical protein GX757_03185, partial [Clostridiales bacterium]|nr:hypothetical protein [Clostridiales bacterium]
MLSNHKNYISIANIKTDSNTAVDPSNPETIPKFVDELPIPYVARPSRQYGYYNENEQFYQITMLETKHKFHKFFPPTKVWGYNGTYPGPTIE